MKYYIAYGSNLNVRQMAFRCPGAKPVGIAMLEGYELLFKGSKTGAYLTIEPKEDGRVPVVVWSVTKAHEEALDCYEGYPMFYYKKGMTLACTMMDGLQKDLQAFVYIMHEDHELARPSSYYVEACAEGYDTFGFDTKYLEEALEKSAVTGQMRRCG